MADDNDLEFEEPDESAEETEDTFEEDLDDIELEEPVVEQSGGVRGLTIVLFIIVLAVAALSIYWHVQRQAAIRAAIEAKQERVQTYQTQFNSVSKNVENAVAAAEEMKIDEAMEAVSTAEKKLTTIASHANEAGDQQWAAFAMQKKQRILEAKEKIAEQQETFEEARRAMEEARDNIKEQIEGLSGKFSNIDLSGSRGGAAPAGAPDMESAPAPEEAPDVESAPAPEQPVEDVPADEPAEPLKPEQDMP
ncbi:MAG: hypothetical protein R6V19_06305 [Armatimonadota bacterium]